MHPDGTLCKATDGTYGTGDCAGCLAYRRWAVRYYGSAQTGHNPTTNVLLLGYERAMLDSFDEDPEVFLKELQEYSHNSRRIAVTPQMLLIGSTTLSIPQRMTLYMSFLGLLSTQNSRCLISPTTSHLPHTFSV